MTALEHAHPGLSGRRRRLWLAWAEWVENMATAGPRPLRVLFEAELGFEEWAAPAVQRLAAAEDRVARRFCDPDRSQTGLVRGLGVSTAVMAMLAVAASVSVDGTDAAFAADRVSAQAVVAPVGAEDGPPVGAAAAARGIGAAKGAVPDAEQAPPPPGAVGRAGGIAAPAVPPSVTVPVRRGALPVGKGMWIWLSDHAEGGDAEAVVRRAGAMGINHLYVRTASLRQGFYAGGFLDRLLPLAHAAKIRVYAWDFPYLDDVPGDVDRAVQAITHLTPDGHRVDGYVADIELRSMGVNVRPDTARAFGAGLRRAVGPNYPLIACVPRPSPQLVTYPFADVVASFDAIAPMVYWLGSDPSAHMAGAIRDLQAFGKPIIPVGQAYDGGAEGGPPGVPKRRELIRFMQAGDRLGAVGVSWWSWQHADQQAWNAVRDAAEFRLPEGPPSTFGPAQVRAYQTLLTSLGFSTPVTGAWDAPMVAAVQAYQRAANLPVTGTIDAATRAVLLTPFAPPIQPQR